MAAGEEDIFRGLDAILETGGQAAALDHLIDGFRREKQFPLLFEARLMQARRELGLPLIQTHDSDDYPPAPRAAYEQAMVEAAREVGLGYLELGNIPRAWPYLRAIGETAAVKRAMETVDAGESVDAVIAIALQEGVHPARGLELIHARYGMCRALTSFGMYEVSKDRERCIGFLAGEIHGEVAARMSAVIESHDGAQPETKSLPEMMAGRDWLFGEYDYYVDTSHLISVLPYCLEAHDPAILEKLWDLCEYGKRLAPSFHSRGEHPFENMYLDYGEYIQALLGRDVEARVKHFRRIAVEAGEEPGPGRTLVNLLLRVGHFHDAVDASLEFLHGEGGEGCPSAIQLCGLAKDSARCKVLAAERGDVLSYVAASGLPERTSRPGCK